MSFLLPGLREHVVLQRFPQSLCTMAPGSCMAPTGGPQVPVAMSTGGSLYTDPGVGERVALRIPCPSQKQFDVVTGASAGARRDRARLQTQP